MTTGRSIVVSLRNITKRFGTLVAINRASLNIEAAEVHALVGENGAGKTTMMNVLYGVHQRDAGQILVHGRPVEIASPLEAIRLGIGMVHQHFKLAPSFTVAENIILGAEPRRGIQIDRQKAIEATRELSHRYGLDLDPRATVRDLPVGLQQRVEILKALYRDIDILILDEPTAVLTPQETRELFATMRRLAMAGKSIIFITHKLREVLAVSDRISVMRQAEIVRTMPNSDVTANDIANLMVGRSVLLRVDKKEASPRPDEALKVNGLNLEGDRGEAAVTDVSFVVRSGEIVGVAGVQGNGQDELVEAIVGFRRPLSGSIAIHGTRLKVLSPKAARECGLAYIPANRGLVGLCLPTTIWENLTVGHHRDRELVTGPLLKVAVARERAAILIEEFDIRGATTDTETGALSGGNQQKVILGRELSRAARVIVAEQPSQGVDIGAIEAIHRLLVRMRDEGKAVFLVSADLDEVTSLSDRILVMYRGRIVGSFEAEETDVETIGRLMGGVEEPLATPSAEICHESDEPSALLPVGSDHHHA